MFVSADTGALGTYFKALLSNQIPRHNHWKLTFLLESIIFATKQEGRVVTLHKQERLIPTIKHRFRIQAGGLGGHNTQAGSVKYLL